MDLSALNRASKDGMFVVVTENEAVGFQEIEGCEAHIANLNGAPFVVVRFLWAGGSEGSGSERSDTGESAADQRVRMHQEMVRGRLVAARRDQEQQERERQKINLALNVVGLPKPPLPKPPK